MRLTEHEVKIVKSYDQWTDILDTMVDGGIEFYILYGEIERVICSIDLDSFDKRHPIMITFELTDDEFEVVEDVLKDILNNTY